MCGVVLTYMYCILVKKKIQRTLSSDQVWCGTGSGSTQTGKRRLRTKQVLNAHKALEELRQRRVHIVVLGGRGFIRYTEWVMHVITVS